MEKMHIEKKHIICFAIVICIVLLIVGVVVFHEKNYNIHAAFACTATEYTRDSSGSCLTVEMETNGGTVEKRFLVNDVANNQLEENDVTEVIGVQVAFEIPQKVIKEKHIGADTLNDASFWTSTDAYDSYARIVDVSFDTSAGEMAQ